MLKRFKEILKSFFTTEEVSAEIHRKNRETVAKIFLFAIAFGLIELISKIFITKTVNEIFILYYGYYLVAGIIGFVLCKTKSGLYTPLIFCLIGFFIIFLVFFKVVPFTEVLIYFLGFIIAIEILLNLNPVFFSISVIFAEAVILLLLPVLAVPGNEPVKFISVANMALVNIIVIGFSFWKRRMILNKYYTENKIKEEEQKSEELLLNVLPERIIEQIKEKGSVEPEVFENVSVFFCQVVNYIELSEQLGPEELVNELNEVFSAFDILVDKNSCVRIKTMGEIYMGVCGLPVADSHHAEHSVACAKDFVEYIKRHNETAPAKIIVRAGVSSGSVIAGIVGIKKYIYDIFGDTVNTAYRMKGLSSAMQVKVSPVTYELVKNDFEFIKQTPIEVKGKGQMETYNLSI